MSENIVLYGSGLFGSNKHPACNQAQLDEVRASGFTTVILWTLHVHENGDLTYNDSPIVSGGVFNPSFSYLPPLVSSLKGSGSTVKTVLFCVGSADVGDFAAIQSLLATPSGTQTLKSNFAALQQALAIDGYDFDLEEFPLENYTSTIVTLTQMLADGGSKIITYCPYTDQSFWLNCLQQVYKAAGKQYVRWYNLQCYSGGAGNTPGSWAETIANATGTGVSNAQAFVIPGLSTAGGPATVQDGMAAFKSDDAGLNGGFIWNSSSMLQSHHSAAQFASALVNGLAPQTQAKGARNGAGLETRQASSTEPSGFNA